MIRVIGKFDSVRQVADKFLDRPVTKYWPPEKEVILTISDEPVAALSIKPLARKQGEAPTIFHCVLPGTKPLPMGEVVARDMDRLVMEEVECPSGRVVTIGTPHPSELGDGLGGLRQGRPQPKRFGEEPERVTVSIPVDVAERWLHGDDEPEIQSIIEEALARR